MAIDTDLDVALVTNSGSNDISFVNLTTGTASAPLSVGTTPIGVATIPRLGRAIVTNSGSNDVSIIDEINQLVLATIPTCNSCLGPTGVAINQDTAQAVVANTLSNNITIVGVDTLAAGSSLTVDQMPLAVSIDPVRNYAAITAAPPPQFSPSNTVDIIDLATNAVRHAPHRLRRSHRRRLRSERRSVPGHRQPEQQHRRHRSRHFRRPRASAPESIPLRSITISKPARC